MSLQVLAYNLKRAISILGAAKALKAMTLVGGQSPRHFVVLVTFDRFKLAVSTYNRLAVQGSRGGRKRFHTLWVESVSSLMQEVDAGPLGTAAVSDPAHC